MKEFLAVPFELKGLSADDSEGTFEGYGAVFNNVDLQRDIIAPGAFAKSLRDKSFRPAMLYQHDIREPIGTWPELREDERGLYAKGSILLEVRRGAEAYALMKAGALSGLSVGFRVTKDEYDRESGVRTIKEATLFEISPVVFPANPKARVRAVKELGIDKPETIREFEEFLRDVGGFSREEAKKIATGGFKAFEESGDGLRDEELARLLKQRGNAFII